MPLFRRSMRSPGNIRASPGLVAEMMGFIRQRFEDERLVATARSDKDGRDIHRKLEKIMHTLDETLAIVTDQNTQVKSLIVLTTTLHQKVIDAMGAGITPSQQMRIDAIFDGVKENADAVTAAIKENTVEGTAGAVTDGQSFGDIKSGKSQGRPDDAGAKPPGPSAEWPGDPNNFGQPTTQTRGTRAGLPDTPGVPNAGASAQGGSATPPGGSGVGSSFTPPGTSNAASADTIDPNLSIDPSKPGNPGVNTGIPSPTGAPLNP